VTKQFTLGKNERLKSRKSIEWLFNEGKSFAQTPYRIYYSFNQTDKAGSSKFNIRFGAGVSAKNFRKAVDRNRIKRITREAFRLQKSILQERLKDKDRELHVFFIYTAREMPVYKEVTLVTEKILQKLAQITDGIK